MYDRACSAVLFGSVALLCTLARTAIAADGLVAIEGSLVTRSGVSLLVSALCSDAGGMIVVREPEEYCGKGLVWTAAGERHEFIPTLRRMRLLSDAEWRTRITWDTSLPPAELFDVACGKPGSPTRAALFTSTFRGAASEEDAAPSIAALIKRAHTLTCSVAPSLKTEGATHEKSGLTVRDHRTSLVVVSWIDPMGPCLPGRGGQEPIELTRRAADGRNTCVGQLGTAPAEVAGVAVGDVVLRIDDTMVTKAADVAGLLAGTKGSAKVLMYRGDLADVDASALRASAATRACGAADAGARFYCWTWSPETVPPDTGRAAPGRDMPRVAGGGDPARPQEAEAFGESHQKKYEAFFGEFGCPRCEEAARLNAPYLAFVKARGCDLSGCAAARAATPVVGRGETPEQAIARIRSHPHSSMPPPQRARATGAAGNGMTIENGTGHALRVHFDGPVSKSVEVADNGSQDVELAVGQYRVAGEVPGSSIQPFYGEQTYEPNMHYWLRFSVKTTFR